MTFIRCSAPGKLFLGGEYAVLQGAPALVASVDRRAFAQTALSLNLPRRSPVYAAVEAAVCEHLGADTRPPRLRIKTRGFTLDRAKFGLGSSSAVAAAIAGALFEHVGKDIEAHRDVLWTLASQGHRAAQGNTGSGADVAAAVYGGLLVFEKDRHPETLTLPNLNFVTVWTGRSASTGELVTQVSRFATEEPEKHSACFAALFQGSLELVAAYRAQDAARIVEATRAYCELMDRLGRESRAPIVTAVHAALAERAQRLGGAAKPSGAGGGDVAVAVFASADAAQTYRCECAEQGLKLLELRLGVPGLRRDPFLLGGNHGGQ